MASLLTLQEAKRHLLVTDDDHNDDITAKTAQASDLVLKHVDTAGDPGWSNGSVTIPGNIKAATALVLSYLYEHRGENMTLSGEIWTAVDRVLVATRPPAVA